MPQKPQYLWDANAWIALIKREKERYHHLMHFWNKAEAGECQIASSAIVMLEVFKDDSEGNDHFPLIFGNKNVIAYAIDKVIVKEARILRRENDKFSKIELPDMIHISTAAFWNCDALHTYDREMLALNGEIMRRDGSPLTICEPLAEEPTLL